MRRHLALLALVLPACVACTPELDALTAWVQQTEDAAAQEGLPCSLYADDLAWRGLPEHMLFVIERESRCQPGAVNATSDDWGLTQIHAPIWLDDLCSAAIACSRSDLLDPATNLDAAAYVWAVQGADAWTPTW